MLLRWFGYSVGTVQARGIFVVWIVMLRMLWILLLPLLLLLSICVTILNFKYSIRRLRDAGLCRLVLYTRKGGLLVLDRCRDVGKASTLR